MRNFPAVTIAFLLVQFYRCTVQGGSNLTTEECLFVERITTVRRSPKTVNAIENNPAYLHCAIGTGAESSDFLVAWTRMRDDALLTAGGHAFTSDTRFQISLKRRTRDWVLLIRRVQASDAGCYLCEINTEPESTLVPVYLNVIPVQEIPKRLYATGVHVANTNLVARMEGDAILLNCTINAKNGGITKHFGDILWTKDILPIEIDDEYKYTSFASISPSGDVVHVLRIAHVTPADGGLYSCEGENIARATQMVHVNSAALATAMAARKSNSATSRMLPHFNLLFILFILYYL